MVIHSESRGIGSARRTWFLPSTSFPSNSCFFSRAIQDCLTGDYFFLPLGLGSHLGKIVWNFPAISVLWGGTSEVRATLVLAGCTGRRGGKGQGEAAGEP